MFIQDFRRDFYDRLIGKRILIIVNYDIDAICAIKILSSLFKCDHMLYTVVPVMGLKEMKRAYMEHKDDVKFVILINCGGCVDILEVLMPEDDVTFFICDSHRPLDICNIYSDQHVYLLADPELEENIPAFETIFRNDDDDDDDDDGNDNNDDDDDERVQDSGAGESDNESTNASSNKADDNDIGQPPARKLSRLEKYEQRIVKQRERRNWEHERERILFEYTQFSYYGRSSALIFYELAWKMSRDNMDLLWFAIVGITEQLILGKIESSVYTLEIQNIQSHVSRLTNKTNDQQSTSTASKISFENDLHLALYRHWSVVESMKHSMYASCTLRLWTLRGEKRLQELLVEMGLPLAQARQNYTSMDLELRAEFFSALEKLSEKYSIPDIVYGSFTYSYGYRNRYSGADFVYGMLAILESIKKGKTSDDCFLEAMDSLSKNHKDILIAGIGNAKLLLSAIFRQVQSSLEARHVKTSGAFFYYILNDEHAFFSFPYGLIMLAKFILNGHITVTKRKNARDIPLIATCPVDADSGLCLMVGIPPVREESPKNFFGKAFEQAAVNCNVAIIQDSFENSLIKIRQMDLAKFLDALTVLLT